MSIIETEPTVPTLTILDSGRLDERDSAFPEAICLPDGDLLCSFSVGGGQFVHGGSDWARSSDQGLTWEIEGTLLAPTADPPSANYLKLSLSPDGQTIYAYGTRYWGDPQEDQFGQRRGEAIFCTSTDNGHSWSEPRIIPMPDCPLEVSHSLRPLASGRLLAPTGLLVCKERLGEEVLVAVSEDGGTTWPDHRTVFRDPAGKLGFWEQKLVEIKPGCLLAVAWTVTLGDYRDQTNSFAISQDDGWTWSPHRSTGIHGQTMTPVSLGGNRLLVLYNRRYGKQGIVAALVTFDDHHWQVHQEFLVYDAQAERGGPDADQSGVDELASFQFGFPTAIELQDGTWLSTHWCVEQNVCGIRWTRFRIDW